MKKILILFVAAILVSCQGINQQPKEFFDVRNRTYQKPVDSVLRKLVEFTANSKIPTKIYAFSSSMILIEEDFDDEQANKYTDYDPKNINANLKDCQERLLININSDSSRTTLDIKSLIKCNITYKKYIGKSVETKMQSIDCKSTGLREKEILDFISNYN
jgi:hypothetical protein